MKFFRPLLTFLLFKPTPPQEPLRPYPLRSFAAQIKRDLQKPLAVGASVTAEYSTSSPIHRAMEIVGHIRCRPTKFARFGARAKKLLPLVTEKMIRQHTVVAASDVVFWDTLSLNPHKTVNALQQFAERASRTTTPVILGTAPLLKNRWLQPGLLTVNRTVREVCREFQNIHLLDLELIYEGIKSKGHFIVANQKFLLDEVAPDALHLSGAGCELIAYEIIRILEERNFSSDSAL